LQKSPIKKTIFCKRGPHTEIAHETYGYRDRTHTHTTARAKESRVESDREKKRQRERERAREKERKKIKERCELGNCRVGKWGGGGECKAERVVNGGRKGGGVVGGEVSEEVRVACMMCTTDNGVERVVRRGVAVCRGVSDVCRRVLLCVAVCCSVLQCVEVRCSVR